MDFNKKELANIKDTISLLDTALSANSDVVLSNTDVKEIRKRLSNYLDLVDIAPNLIDEIEKLSIKLEKYERNNGIIREKDEEIKKLKEKINGIKRIDGGIETTENQGSWKEYLLLRRKKFLESRKKY